MKPCAFFFILALAAMPAASQTAGQKLQFEVASVKPNTTGRPGLIETPPIGRVSIVAFSASRYIGPPYVPRSSSANWWLLR